MLSAWLKSNISNAARLKWGSLRYILLYPSQRLWLATKRIAYRALRTRICFRLHPQKGFFRSYLLSTCIRYRVRRMPTKIHTISTFIIGRGEAIKAYSVD